MKKEQLYELFNIDDLRHLPEAIMSLIEGDIENRNNVYKELLRMNNYDLSFDWFSSIYEMQMAQRKTLKQDFTPNSVARLASLLTGNLKGRIHEPTAGNGSMIIADWWVRCQKGMPWDFRPSENMVYCWELSSSCIPILLLNLSVRGIMGYVFHGDVLTFEVKSKYILLNKKDDPLSFSDITKDDGSNMFIQKVKK
ncbi:MAG: N-6 DNA methylase [Tannerella sp.]|jgi:hypothetical protein|nr:N-6 DNA methylase [Tannerella sp.]